MRKMILIFFLSLPFTSNIFSGNLWIDLESGIVFTGYNDVQIPSDTGTRFSLKDDIPSENEFFYRLLVGYQFNEKHSIFALAAPLRVEGKGKNQKQIDFAGKTFAPGSDLKTLFRFDSYRISYLYTFYQSDQFILGAGLTGKIRDAEISVEDQSGNKGTRSDTGFVPLIHLKLQWFFIKPFSLLFEGDGLAAPQGRAEDFLLALNYDLNQDLSFRIGYRLLEGGSDGGGNVYTFSMFHYIGIGMTYKF